MINGLPVVRFNSANNTHLSFPRPMQDDFTFLCVFQSAQGLAHQLEYKDNLTSALGYPGVAEWRVRAGP